MQPDRGALVRKAILIALWAAYVALWTGGVGGHVLYGGTPTNTGWAAPVFLLLAGLIVIASAPWDYRALAIAAVMGFCAEVAGVHLGVPFGHYVYTRALRPSVFGVPAVLLFAWMVLIAFVRQLRWNALAAAACMVAIDLVIDPVASRTLGYWQWLDPGVYYGVPAINFAGWFTVSAVLFALLPGQPQRSLPVTLTGLSIILFFTLIALVHALYIPVVIGLLLVVLTLIRARPVTSS